MMETLAFVLLATDLPVPDLLVPYLLKPVSRAAVREQVMDPREVHYTFLYPKDFRDDLGRMRNRYQLLQGVPPVEDAQRFVPREVINEHLALNREYKGYLESRQAWESHNYFVLQEEINEVDQLYATWDTLRDAQCSYYFVSIRREALNKLRDRLGVQDYYRGLMPNYVPVWRFGSVSP